MRSIKNLGSAFLLIACMTVAAFAQTKQPKDKAIFRESKPGYYQNNIQKGIAEQDEKDVPKKVSRSFKVDISTLNVPKSVDEFTTVWASQPVSQGSTGTCWSYSTTSFFEEEIYRQTKQQVKLSEMYTVYWEYVDKAKRFVQQRGVSVFDEGSEANALKRCYKEHGIVPEENYTGLLPGHTIHNHTVMIDEMRSYLAGVKTARAWNETDVISTIKSILNHYMGEPPTKVSVKGKDMSPDDYLKNVLKLNPDDYIDIMSLVSKPYWEKAEYEVDDNWWHSADYINMPLDEFMSLVKRSVRAGYSLFVGGDVSEAGFDGLNNVALVPSFDIPSEYIDEYARQFRFSNGSTTDDHGMALVGYKEVDGKDWYLIKDSGAGSRNCGKDSKNFGYYFFHEDYVKLKIMTLLVHKDMVKEQLKKLKS